MDLIMEKRMSLWMLTKEEKIDIINIKDTENMHLIIQSLQVLMIKRVIEDGKRKNTSIERIDIDSIMIRKEDEIKSMTKMEIAGFFFGKNNFKRENYLACQRKQLWR